MFVYKYGFYTYFLYKNMLYYKCNTSYCRKDIEMNRVLLLNSENEPIRICSWKRAVVLLLKGKAECDKRIKDIEDYINIDNASIPRVIKLNYDVAVPYKELPFPYNRENVFVRDDYTCQYCGRKFPASELTLDHVFPKSRLGPDIWENIVTCCKECNQYKADRTPKEAGMKLLRRPFRPETYFEYEMKKYSDYEQLYWRQWAS